MSTSTPSINRLIDIMTALRNPDGGCPWDVVQTFETIAPYTVEEAYEVADAIARKDMDDLKDELGDLLFQVIFHARMAEECGAFDFNDIVDAICEKMIRRHPHVFDDAAIPDADAQIKAWEAHKAAERERRAEKNGQTASVLDGVAHGLPAVLRAVKLQKRAARVGFDWDDPRAVLDKVREELDELEQVLEKGEGQDRQREEMGDLLFSCANLARFMGVDPEDALLAANGKFERRFRAVEGRLKADGKAIKDASLDEMERLWGDVKYKEKQSRTSE